MDLYFQDWEEFHKFTATLSGHQRGQFYSYMIGGLAPYVLPEKFEEVLKRGKEFVCPSPSVTSVPENGCSDSSKETPVQEKP